jgi:hypothetical protein
MNSQQLAKRFAEIGPKARDQLDALVGAIEFEARQSARSAAQLWLHGDPVQTERAEYVLAGIDELAITPLLDGPRPATSDSCYWLLQLLVDDVVELQKKIVTRLHEALGDRRPLPPPAVYEPVEESLPARRVCDEAYLLLRRLLVLSEDALKQIMNAEAFLHLPVKDKDAAIARFINTGVWARLIGDID